MTVYPIQGIPVAPGQLPPLRYECKDWSKNHEESIQVSLFIRALQKFYDLKYDEDLSYFRVAGIHGYPANLVWNGAKPPSNGDKAIYCTHNMLTFPTWHRVYMLLFEQRIHDLMLDTIEKDLKFETIGEKQEWSREADLWRLPYWNWGLPRNYEMPDIFTTEKISIRVPRASNGKVQVPESRVNPLYRFQLRVDGKVTKMGDLPEPYTVHDTGSNADKLPWSKCSGTSRWGIDKTTPESQWSLGINNWAKSNDAIGSHQWADSGDKTGINTHTVSDLIGRIMSESYCKDFRAFATTATHPEKPTDWTDYLSLEFVHNGLHDFIGGGDMNYGVGHMGNVPVAAFDPIFFMHHCYVDFLFALRQTLYQTQWFQAGDSPQGSDDLPPFRHRRTTASSDLYDYHTSDYVRDWRKLGYDYDVLVVLPTENGIDDPKYLARIREYLNQYGITGQLLLDDPKKIVAGPRSEMLSTSTAGFPAPGITREDSEYDDYVINVIYDRYALNDGDPYTIHFYVGSGGDQIVPAPGTGPGLHVVPSAHPHHVGSVNTFSFSYRAHNEGGEVQCSNCARQAEEGVLSTAQIPLTANLYGMAASNEFPGLSDLAPHSVKEYLRENLLWVARSVSGDEIDPARLPQTKIYVLNGKATHYAEASQPSLYRNYHGMSSVTHNKPLGASHHEY